MFLLNDLKNNLISCGNTEEAQGIPQLKSHNRRLGLLDDPKGSSFNGSGTKAKNDESPGNMFLSFPKCLFN